MRRTMYRMHYAKLNPTKKKKNSQQNNYILLRFLHLFARNQFSSALYFSFSLFDQSHLPEQNALFPLVLESLIRSKSK